MKINCINNVTKTETELKLCKHPNDFIVGEVYKLLDPPPFYTPGHTDYRLCISSYARKILIHVRNGRQTNGLRHTNECAYIHVPNAKLHITE